MNIILLDTMVVIWGIQGWCNLGQENMKARAKAAIKDINDSGSQVAISAITLAELLSGFNEGKREEFRKKIEDNLLVLPFDGLASLTYAKLWDRNNRTRIRAEVEDQGEQTTRARMKADTMIIASAISRNVKFIYSHDINFIASARGHIEVKELPEVMEQREINFDAST